LPPFLQRYRFNVAGPFWQRTRRTGCILLKWRAVAWFSSRKVDVGVLYYDGEEFDLDDRVLTHLQIVISTKLRRGEDFFLSWAVPAERGSGRHAIWIDNGVPLHFFYTGSRSVLINREWIETMIASAGRPSGLVLTEEPTPAQSPSST
jgi:hypothetical protein